MWKINGPCLIYIDIDLLHNSSLLQAHLLGTFGDLFFAQVVKHVKRSSIICIETSFYCGKIHGPTEDYPQPRSKTIFFPGF
jgi:hypothetical protein